MGLDLEGEDMINDNKEIKEFKGNLLLYEIKINNILLEDYNKYILYDNKIFKLNNKEIKYYKIKVQI